VELPKGGVTLDVIAEWGRVRLSNRDTRVQESEGEQRLNTEIAGGGPTLRLRNEHADIVIREGGMMDTEAGERKDAPHAPHAAPAPPEPPAPIEPPKPPAPPHDASR
jgi:hypothetical protein